MKEALPIYRKTYDALGTLKSNKQNQLAEQVAVAWAAPPTY